ncbi:MAG: hypothetical protein E6J16_00865 [Chloroflexota bacterium]|nr:MAG: hypothetical protein E6J16_00865 [Chloroflexota bacterium]TMD86371.1 MAG: hypothetical protein E6I78_05880 [Chloroflexota bacterium]
MAEARELVRDRGPIPPTRQFEWTVVALCTWLMAGAYLDSWAHRHLAGLETFFTPWHAVLYSGMFAILAFLAITALRNRDRGYSLPQVLPAGYSLSLLGCVLFGIGGVIDMAWHLRFGIEVSLAALISPPHLLLMLALGLIVTGPLRAAWRRQLTRAPFTAVVSASLLLSMFTFFNQFDQPLVNTLASTKAVAPDTIRYLQQLGILGIMVQTALLTGVVLYLLSRFTLPFGSITLLAGLNGALLGSLEQHFDLIPIAIVGGLLADLVMVWLRPGPDRVVALRFASFIGPVAVSSLYLGFLQVTRGIGWPITLWLGSIIVSGAIGVLLSYLSVHPPIPRVDIA